MVANVALGRRTDMPIVSLHVGGCSHVPFHSKTPNFLNSITKSFLKRVGAGPPHQCHGQRVNNA